MEFYLSYDGYSSYWLSSSIFVFPQIISLRPMQTLKQKHLKWHISKNSYKVDHFFLAEYNYFTNVLLPTKFQVSIFKILARRGKTRFSKWPPFWKCVNNFRIYKPIFMIFHRVKDVDVMSLSTKYQIEMIKSKTSVWKIEIMLS